MKKLLVLLSIVFFSTYGFSQDEKKIEQYAGINAGFTTGYGFSYKAIFEKIGVQATVLPIKTNESKFVSLGVTGFYMLRNRENLKTFAYLGNHFINTYADSEDNIGLGWGTSFGNKVQLSFMVGYGVYDAFDTFGLLPTLETGLFVKL